MRVRITPWTLAEIGRMQKCQCYPELKNIHLGSGKGCACATPVHYCSIHDHPVRGRLGLVRHRPVRSRPARGCPCPVRDRPIRGRHAIVPPVTVPVLSCVSPPRTATWPRRAGPPSTAARPRHACPPSIAVPPRCAGRLPSTASTLHVRPMDTMRRSSTCGRAGLPRTAARTDVTAPSMTIPPGPVRHRPAHGWPAHGRPGLVRPRPIHGRPDPVRGHPVYGSLAVAFLSQISTMGQTPALEVIALAVLIRPSLPTVLMWPFNHVRHDAHLAAMAR